MLRMTESVGEYATIPAVHQRWDDVDAPDNCDGEVICGITNDCIIFPQTNNTSEGRPTQPEFIEYAFPDQGILDIQEVEVVCESSWNNNGIGANEECDQLEEDVKYSIKYEGEEIDIPLPEEDSYSSMRPYPCDFCSRRFRKKVNLMNHMVSHQTDRPYGCNMCGARYRRKCDLINHMKIHAYAPGRDLSSEEEEEEEEEEPDQEPDPEEDILDDDDELFSDMDGEYKVRRKKGPSKRKKYLAGKSKLTATDESSKGGKRRNYGGSAGGYHSKRKSSESNMISGNTSHSYVDEDMRLLKQPAPVFTDRDQSPEPQHERESLPPRWPVIDESRPYVCQHCGVGFAREKALGSHARIHAGDSPFECNTCGEMFWDVNLLREHSKTKHPSRYDFEPSYDEQRYPDFHCEVCGMVFHRQDLLKRHSRIHVKPEPDDEDGNHECQECGQNFTSRSELLTHAETHGRYQPHRCMLCGERFIDPAAVATHVKRRHARSIPPNACTLCGKTCRDRRSLQKHTWVHSAERSFGCQNCGKRFHSRARLKRHMVSHRDKAVTCVECGEEFPDGRALINHRHSHNRDSLGRQFSCLQCGKTFGSRSSQQIHARIHTGERPYGCRFCWKAFADGGTLRKHERIHTGEKPYACPVCPRAFNQRVVLREHIRSHHSGAEMRSANANIPYFGCKVCAASFSCSEDLCAHLIKHSDENTAKHRLPKVGPRKYKRRRKFSLRELPSSNPGQESAVEATDDDSDVDTTRPKAVKRKYSKSRTRFHTTENLQSVAKTLDSVVQHFNSFVSDARNESNRKSHKSKVHKKGLKTNLDHLSKPTMSNNSISGGFLKSTRPAGEGRLRPRTKNVCISTLNTLKAVSSKDLLTENNLLNNIEAAKGRPRTKNVSYHNVKMAKLEPAKFPHVPKPGPGRPKGVKNGAKHKVEARPPPMIENDVLALKAENIQDEEKTGIKVEYTCEMCSETFHKRSELLVHVPIHI